MFDEFCERLTNFRKKVASSASDFARSIGQQYPAYVKYERGERKPAFDILVKIATVHKVNINWLLTGEGEMFNSPSLKLKKTPDDIRFAVFGNKLNKLQNLNELSIEEMAEILNISEDLYVDLCLSRQKPTINVILNVMNNFDVTFDWFLR